MVRLHLDSEGRGGGWFEEEMGEGGGVGQLLGDKVGDFPGRKRKGQGVGAG